MQQMHTPEQIDMLIHSCTHRFTHINPKIKTVLKNNNDQTDKVYVPSIGWRTDKWTTELVEHLILRILAGLINFKDFQILVSNMC